MSKKAFYILVLFSCLAVLAKAQDGSLSNNRQKSLLKADSVSIIDSLTVIPYSLQIINAESGQKLDTSYYSFENNAIQWKKTPPVSLNLSYRVFPFNFEQPLRHLDTTIIGMSKEDGLLQLIYNPFEEEAKLVDFKGLNYNGNFTRGISFGNNQDLVLNSRFNLQMSGDLGDDIEILAAITDENIPLQPQGNTQQIQEFDRIFIQITRKNNSLIAGDYELRKPEGYFMNYFKKLQGATFQNSTTALGKGLLQSNASVAIARGKFTRNNIEQQEGNQGPYKLRGAEGERFIIVLAGTEKVWIDGELLERGLERDYIIDYNRGELTFTNNQLITKDSRIVIEFEYSDQNYLRTLYALNTNYQSKNWKIYFNIYNQQDSRTSTGNISLSQNDREVLRSAGDNLAQAIVQSIDTLTEDNNFRVRYELVDTLISCNGVDTTIQVLRFSSSQEAVYTARFSSVGANNGNYILDAEQAANERVYKFVAPDPLTCQPQGDFEPITQLTAPEQQQMFTLGTEYTLSGKTSGKTEIAISRLDLNRFSELDSRDDYGVAAFTQLSQNYSLGKDSSIWNLSSNVSYEYVQKDFNALNPYRNPDFLRDWNLANVQGISNVENADEHIGLAGIDLGHYKFGQFRYSFSTFLRDTIYRGFRHTGAYMYTHHNWKILAQVNQVNTREVVQRTQLFKPNIRIEKTFASLDDWRLEFYGEREKSDRILQNTDTLSANSFFFDRFQFSLSNPEDSKYKFNLQYNQRHDYAPDGKDYTASTTAREAGVEGQWQELKGFKIGGNFTYRQLLVLDSLLTNQTPAETYLSRIDVGFNLLKGVFQSNTTYEISSGQEAKVEFTYVEVMPGSGTHIWLDSLYNNDGIIQPNEMEIAPFQDQANFVKITTITDEFIRTNNVGLTQSLRINPRAIWFNETGIKAFLGKFSTISNLKINRKTQESEGVSPWNPFQLNVVDSALVAVTSNVRNVLFFNRGDAVYDIQLGQNDNRNKFVQTTGFESRKLAEYYLQGRLNLDKTISSQLRMSTGQRSSDSEFFNNKDYQINFFSVEPQFTLLIDQKFRTILKYKYQSDKNILGENMESANQHDFGLEATFNQSLKTAIRMNMSYINIDFTGVASSPVGFAILNGLQDGQNFLWNLSLDRQLGQNIQLNLSYEGRKTGEADVVHVGRAQISANF